MARKLIVRRHWEDELSENEYSSDDEIFLESDSKKVPKSKNESVPPLLSHEETENTNDEVDMAVQRNNSSHHEENKASKYGNEEVPKLRNNGYKKSEITGKRKSTGRTKRASMRNSAMTPYVMPAVGMDRHEKRIVRLNTMQEKHEYYESLPPFGFLDFFGCLICIFSYIADVGTDIFVAVLYFSDNRYTLFGLTVSFIVVPAVVTSCFSIVWYIQDSKHYQKYGYKVSAIRWILRIIFHLLQIAPILR